MQTLVLMSTACVLVTAKRKLVGRLEVLQSFVHFHCERVVEGSNNSSYTALFEPAQKNSWQTENISVVGEVTEEGGNSDDHVNGLRKNMSDLSQMSRKSCNLEQNVKRHRRWPLTHLRKIHIMRYLLHPSALELFFSAGVPPALLNFTSANEANEVAKKICSLANSISLPKGAHREGVILVDRRKAMELAEKAKAQWRRREISNFEYLMLLNTFAGRSYNDLMQYPVFPWVVADYESSALDLSAAETFRDLSKPVGALNPRRFETFQERYETFSDPGIPSFFYGSHYSTAGIVLYYLIRLEPFSTLNRQLQGGKFDHADRLFASISSTWTNCLSNTSDVKELIPEFFYMPEFLENANNYFLGLKQDGEKLSDVVLPAWAKDSPELFIRKHREALECEYVSEHLHQWIDLIFGYKQRGPAAVEAGNVFYYLTYEGAVDLDGIDDPFERASVEDQIANFGQTPVQLFQKKHPKRSAGMTVMRALSCAPQSISLTSILTPAVPAGAGKGTGKAVIHGVSDFSSSSVVFVGLMESKVVTLTRGLVMCVRSWITPHQQQGTFNFHNLDPYFGFSDSLFCKKIKVPSFVGDVDLHTGCFDILQMDDQGGYLLSCGHWDNSFCCVSLSDGKLICCIRQHKDIVTCLAVSSDRSVLITGSRDTTMMVWDIQTVLPAMGSVSGFVSCYPRFVLCGHDDTVTTVVAKAELDIIVSASLDGTCLIHSLAGGRLVRSLQHPHHCPVLRVAVSSSTGHIALYSHDDLMVHVSSMNGKFLASSDISSRLSSVVVSSCGDYLITGGDGGHVTAWSIHTLERIRRYEGSSSPICSLAVESSEDCFLAGLEDGRILIFSSEVQQLKKAATYSNSVSAPSSLATVASPNALSMVSNPSSLGYASAAKFTNLLKSKPAAT
eukprot:TRINITY_DN13517_c0_g1_i1.p1 TRINITY_DN13517_c0_g1~~TRINITY_DN13517_c0_g1_i1.p1  ORF type:complete len:901 (-),score=178.89 TRINITY_DN13517_c0_g1_i1:137-2839(-)